MYHLGYRGGSGGFVFLHFLMLSDQYYASFENNFSINFIVDYQWDIHTPADWKKTEIWPNNVCTFHSDTPLKKILYHCNPTQQEFFNYPQRQFIDHFVVAYNNIKDSTWPSINSIDDFNYLPADVKQEVIETLRPYCQQVINYFFNLPAESDTFIWLYTDVDTRNELAWYKKAAFYRDNPFKEKITNLSKHATLWKETLVDSSAVYFLENSDIQIKLQHWANEPDILVDHQLIDKVNQKQYNLLNHWKKLHPPELLQKIGIR